MIIGIGYDLVEIDRISRALSRHSRVFAEKILHHDELSESSFRFNDNFLSPSAATYIASRFAAKEAAVKALGTGFRDGLTPKDILIASNSLGKPCLSFHNQAHVTANKLGVMKIFLSITHEKSMAGAMVILEGAA